MQTSEDSRQPECVLVVDDEPTIRDTVAFNLQREGLEVALASTGIEAIERARTLEPDLVVLDIMLPGMDGFEVCRRIREHSTVPILLLSARGEEIDRVVGLEIGADDYLTKPFAMRELVARVRAMLRRARMVRVPQVVAHAAHAGTATADIDPAVVAGDIVIDVPRREASIGDRSLALKPKEFDLLLYFARHPGIVMTRDALLREVWGYDYPVDTRTVDVHIRWLRQKIENDPAVPSRIVTVRGHGYRFLESDE
jgi:two-component system alkaline phosphatase synthesis response regulator PhoP